MPENSEEFSEKNKQETSGRIFDELDEESSMREKKRDEFPDDFYNDFF